MLSSVRLKSVDLRPAVHACAQLLRDAYSSDRENFCDSWIDMIRRALTMNPDHCLAFDEGDVDFVAGHRYLKSHLVANKAVFIASAVTATSVTYRSGAMVHVVSGDSRRRLWDAHQASLRQIRETSDRYCPRPPTIAEIRDAAQRESHELEATAQKKKAAGRASIEQKFESFHRGRKPTPELLWDAPVPPRVTHCWDCMQGNLTPEAYPLCRSCLWIVCNCGACGCYR